MTKERMWLTHPVCLGAAPPRLPQGTDRTMVNSSELQLDRLGLEPPVGRPPRTAVPPALPPPTQRRRRRDRIRLPPFASPGGLCASGGEAWQVAIGLLDNADVWGNRVPMGRDDWYRTTEWN